MSVATLACAKSPTDAPQQVTSTPTLNWRTTSVHSAGLVGANSTIVAAIDGSFNVTALNRQTGQIVWTRTLASPGPAIEVQALEGSVIAVAGDLFCLNASDGSLRWTLHDNEGFGTLALTIDDSTIYPSTYRSSGSLTAVDARSGAVRWKTSLLPADSSIKSGETFRILASSRDQNLLGVAYVWFRKDQPYPRGGVAVVDTRTGSTLWTRMLPVKRTNRSSFPSLPTLRGGLLALSTEEGWAYVYGATDGVLRTSIQPVIPSNLDSTVSGPSGDVRAIGLDQDVLAVGSSGSNKLRVYDNASSTLLWERDPEEGSEETAILITQGLVLSYHLNGAIVASEKRTGKEVWRLSKRNGQSTYQFPRIDGTDIFVGNSTSVASFKLLK